MSYKSLKTNLSNGQSTSATERTEKSSVENFKNQSNVTAEIESPEAPVHSPASAEKTASTTNRGASVNPVDTEGEKELSNTLQQPIDDDVEEVMFNAVPTEKDYVNAKALLMKANGDNGYNMYDHLTNCIKFILEQQPKNTMNIFEEISREIKRTNFNSETATTVFEKVEPSTEVSLAQVQTRLFRKGTGDVEGEEEAAFDEDEPPPVPNMMQLVFFFEQAGVGMNREEIFRLWLSLKKLATQYPVQTVRFWGKIFGREQNYYIAEVVFPEGEDEEEEGEVEEEEEPKDEVKDELGEEEQEDEEGNPKPKYPPLPKNKWKPIPPLAAEDRGTGINKMAYFISNEPGKNWTRLPRVTPQQINASRSMRKFFTGRLDAPVVTYPPFPGKEANYLRAQIARISASTLVSPMGYYELEEDEDEDEENPPGMIKAEEYEGLTVEELSDPELGNWVHHSMAILPQGRCIYIKPPKVKPDKDDNEEEAEEEAEEEEDDEEPEEGPPLLTPLNEDDPVFGQPAWRVRLSSKLLPRYAVAVLDSIRWPGAHAFAFKTTFENVYYGWGQKFDQFNLNPVNHPRPLKSYPDADEGLREAVDPTPEEEKALEEAKLAKLKKAEEGEEANEEAEEEGEDE